MYIYINQQVSINVSPPIRTESQRGVQSKRLLLDYGSSQYFLESIGGFQQEQSVGLESFCSLDLSPGIQITSCSLCQSAPELQ